jgi:hypothetical protein
MSVGNEAVLQALLESLDDFARDRLSVEDVQRHLQSSLSLLDSGAGRLNDSIRLAEADLEEIRFTMLLDEQRPAAVFRLDPLRAAIADRLGVNEGVPPSV